MYKTKSRITILLVTVILLPAIFISTYELSSLKTNEETIETIYYNQLDAILFSLNQYAGDIASSTALKIGIFSEYEDSRIKTKTRNYLQNTYSPVIEYAFFYDCFEVDNFLSISRDSIQNEELIKEIKEILRNNRKLISRLKTYLDGGYQKIEPFNLKSGKSSLLFIFLNSNEKGETKVCGIVFNPDDFINDVMVPRIQATAGDKFGITITDTIQSKTIYSINVDESDKKMQRSESFWILPGYTAGIRMANASIRDLVRERAKINILLILIVDAILLFGAFYIIRNVRREMLLAQIKSDFVSSVSHEIRTPLSLISMYIETLQMGRINPEEKVIQYYNIIEQETKRLSGIVNKILCFSQIESGKRKYKFSKTDINEVVNNVINSYKFHIEKKGFNFVYELSGNMPDDIIADPDAITDAVINLLDNALKYSKDEKFIELTTFTEKKQIVIQVKDKGIGISPQYRKLIFDKFYRITEGALAHHAKGSGLGLTIIKHIMEAHNGKITVESNIGKGSIFRLKIPIK